MRYLELRELLQLHQLLLDQSGGMAGIRDLGALEAALAQPRMTFGGSELYPCVAEKAAALGYSLIKNHPFVDGNKRAGHAAMEVFLVLNGYEFQATVNEQARTILQVASGELGRDAFTAWLQAHLVERREP